MGFGEKGKSDFSAGELAKNREAISKLAASAEARQLIRLLEQKGSVHQAARAAAGGDVGALSAMLESLMRTDEGARLAQSIGEQAKQAGLE